MSGAFAGLFVVLTLAVGLRSIDASVAPDEGTAALNAAPSIILMMADDLGYGDVGFMGNEVIQTPHLDQMAQDGLTLTRFYSAAPVCSPTRGSALTGRHPFRLGVAYANSGHLREEEHTLAEALKEAGYATGFFGKWHLGTLTKDVKDSNRGGPDGAQHYSVPSQHGFDVSFATEAKVPTHDPMVDPEEGGPYGTAYWDTKGHRVDDNLDGDDSRVIVDRAVPFLRESVAANRPFFAVIWFHAPHRPCVASDEWRAPYAECSEVEQHFYGCISAMDAQIGRVRAELDSLGVADNTLVWFCSDNGPEGKPGRGDPGSAGPLRERKRSLYEGGVRVPAVVVWPSTPEAGGRCDVPLVTSDFYPTLVALTGGRVTHTRRIDGIDARAILTGRRALRDSPIGFQARTMQTWVADRYKLVVDLPVKEKGETRVELYDLLADIGETTDIAADHPRIVQGLRGQLNAWLTTFNSE